MTLKDNWQEFKAVLDRHGITKLYHFTDRDNLQSIINNGGLYSWADCESRGISIAKPGGSQQSRNLDCRDGLQNYVRVCFTQQHPMMFVAKNNGRITDPVILEINPEVAYWKGTKYADRNATKTGARIGSDINALKRIHFKSVKADKHFDLDVDEQPFFQAEILVPNCIPLEYITNIGNFGIPIPSQPHKTKSNNSKVKTNYPSASNYVDFIKNAEYNFATLTDLRPVFDVNNDPIFCEGDNSVVFKMKDIKTGKLYAVKCFTNYQESRGEAYRKIADCLANVDAPYILPIKYLENELFVNTNQSQETEFPILLMDWADGTPLDIFIDNCRDSSRLQKLSFRFSLMTIWLIQKPFAHGDIKPDNILINPTTLQPVLVDYDGMFVPSMKGEKARELGSPNYRHPNRTTNDFDERIDDFALTVIQLYIDSMLVSRKRNLAHSFQDFIFTEYEMANINPLKLPHRILGFIDDVNFAYSLGRFMKVIKNKLHIFYYNDVFYYDDEDIDVWRKSIPDDEKRWYDSFGAIYLPYWKKLIGFHNDNMPEEYTVKKNCETIGENAFSIFGTGVDRDTTGQEYIWYEPNTITKRVILPEQIKVIEKRAFYSCQELESINFPESLYEVGGEAFAQCGKLKAINIPHYVHIIKKAAFSGCKELKYISVDPNNTKFDSRDNCNAIIETSSNALICGCASTIIPDSVIEIGEEAFKDCQGLVSITIPSSIFRIAKNAFNGCSNIAMVGINCISSWCRCNSFYEADNIYEEYVDVYYSNPLYSSKHLFLNNTEVSDLVIPNTVTNIADYTFINCQSLKSLIISESVKTIGREAFKGCSKLHTITIPNSTTTIGRRAFDGCCSLTSIMIPKSVSIIQEGAFSSCCSLTSIIVAPENTNYDSRDNCNAIIETGTNSLICGCASTIIPDTIKKIGAFAFFDCGDIESIKIPSSVSAIGEFAFGGCSKLNKVVIDNLKSWCECNFVFEWCLINDNEITPNYSNPLWEAGHLYHNESEITELIIPNSVSKIGDYAFIKCLGLKSLVISESVVEIGVGAFHSCINLASVTIGSSVKSIGRDAFQNCIGLTSITIPYSVEKIDEDAFDGCKSLTSIMILNPNIDISYYSFGHTDNSQLTIEVPLESMQRIQDIVSVKVIGF